MGEGLSFAGLDSLAKHLRVELEERPFILVYAYNGTGKTRLSVAFKNLGKTSNDDGVVLTKTLHLLNSASDLTIESGKTVSDGLLLRHLGICEWNTAN